MNRYVIERDLPGAGKLTSEQIRGAAMISNEALSQIGPAIQWVQSHVTDDRIYCVYLAESESVIREHARIAGLPADRISKVGRVIDPLTGTASN